MTNTEKTRIINEIVQVIDKKNRRKNSRREVVDIYNTWANSSNYKIDDMYFLAWILSFIEDVLKMNSNIVREIAEEDII